MNPDPTPNGAATANLYQPKLFAVLRDGVAVTGTIARTATHVRAGARSPVAGLLHSAFF